MAKLDRDALIAQDVNLARQTLVSDGKAPDDLKLSGDIQEDWEILSSARHLPEAEKQEITRAVARIAKSHRKLAEKILPPGLLDGHVDFYRLMLILDNVLASKVPAGSIDEESLGAIARTKRTVARGIIHPRLVQHVDQQVNEIINGNVNKPLEDTIERVIAFLKNECLGKHVEGIAFYLVNEENYHEQVDKLTKTSIGIPATRIRRSDFEEGKEDLGLFDPNTRSGRIIVERRTNRIYFELIMGGRKLGFLEVDLKPSTRLSNIELDYIRQAMSRLDNKIVEALHSKRLEIITSKAHSILHQYGTKENFEQGIARFMELVCLYSTAYEAEVMVDIFGDGEDWFAKTFNDDREITPIEMDNVMKAEIKIPSGSRRVDEKRALVLDITDSSEKNEGEIIGKVIFRTKKDADELTNEDHVILNLCSEILSSHILQWRKDLALRTEGVDHQIARNMMREGVEEMVKEMLTVFYTDIAGYTYICEILKEALEEDEGTTKDIETLKAVLEKFLNLIQRTGQMYGGIWDKAVGDMGLMEFGPPIDKKGMDPLGYSAAQRRPEYFAANALKAAVLVRHGLDEVTSIFRTKLLEIAHRKYASEGLKPVEELNHDEQNALLKKLEDETRLSPKISTTTSVYTGEVGFMKLKLGAAHDWTAIGDTMNSAARVQGTSLKGEIRIPLLTRDLVAPHINMDTEIPYNCKGNGETWSEFFRDKLGLDPERVKVEFVEYYEGYKNKTGRNVVFTVNIKEDRSAEIPPNATMTMDQLLQYDGEEFAVVSRRPVEGNMISFKLRTISADPERAVFFRVNIPQGGIDERVERFKSPIALNRRSKTGAGNTLFVHDGKLTEFVWKSIEEDQDAQLRDLAEELQVSKEKVIVYTKMVPTGCYELSSESYGDLNHELLAIRKDNHIFDVRVGRSRIHRGVGAIMKDNEALYDFQSYYEVIRPKITSNRPVVFVRKRHFYIVEPREAEMYLTGIVTRPGMARTESSVPVKSSSNPPGAPATILPAAHAPEKKIPKFWTALAEQQEKLYQEGNRLLIDNWNHFVPVPKPEAKE